MMTEDQLRVAMMEDAHAMPGFYQVQSQNGGRKPKKINERKAILDALADGPKFANEVARSIGQTVKETSGLLQSLQKKDKVKRMDDRKPALWGLPDA